MMPTCHHHRQPWLFAALLVLISCAPATVRPSANDEPRKASYAISPDEPSGLHTTLAPSLKKHPGKTGVRLLSYGEDALHLRLALIQAAERSVDLQYYIVENDDSDKLLLQSMLEAADRGVRIRLLIDSLNFKQDDATWPLLNSHKNIEVRIFNPLMTRDTTLMERAVNMIVGLHHYSRRMHNKIIIADNQIAITGGRNLGDSYFDASKDFNFRDVDIYVIGALVPSLSKSFDRYWNDDESFPLVRLMAPPKKDPKALNELRASLEQHWKNDDTKYKHVTPSVFRRQLVNDANRMLWVDASLAADSPAKLDEPVDEVESKPAETLTTLANRAQEEFIMVSPYFIPREEGVEWLKQMVKRGVRVRVLTNSLASTDVVMAHTGYSRYRQQLVEAGVELYEMKPQRGSERSERFASNAPTSLHSKLYMVDRKDIMLGSFNFDPRSIELNTEQLIVLHSPALAKEVSQMFDRAISPEASFRVTRDDLGVRWETKDHGKDETYELEPEAGFWRRTGANLLFLLPTEGQL